MLNQMVERESTMRGFYCRIPTFCNNIEYLLNIVNILCKYVRTYILYRERLMLLNCANNIYRLLYVYKRILSQWYSCHFDIFGVLNFVVHVHLMLLKRGYGAFYRFRAYIWLVITHEPPSIFFRKLVYSVPLFLL